MYIYIYIERESDIIPIYIHIMCNSISRLTDRHAEAGSGSPSGDERPVGVALLLFSLVSLLFVL